MTAQAFAFSGMNARKRTSSGTALKELISLINSWKSQNLKDLLYASSKVRATSLKSARAKSNGI